MNPVDCYVLTYLPIPYERSPIAYVETDGALLCSGYKITAQKGLSWAK